MKHTSKSLRSFLWAIFSTRFSSFSSLASSFKAGFGWEPSIPSLSHILSFWLWECISRNSANSGSSVVLIVFCFAGFSFCIGKGAGIASGTFFPFFILELSPKLTHLSTLRVNFVYYSEDGNSANSNVVTWILQDPTNVLLK
jgi:hypothetical protein